MKSLMSFCESNQKKLGRQLTNKEKDLLKWIYDQHQEETLVGKKINIYAHIKREKNLQY